MSLYSKNKIYSIFAGLGGFFLLFGLLLLNQSLTIKKFSSEIDQHWLPGMVAINAINTAANDYRAAVALHIIATDANWRDEIELTIEQIGDDASGWQTKYQQNADSDQDRALYQKMMQSYANYVDASKQVMAFSQGNDRSKAAELFRRNRALFSALTYDLQKLVEWHNKGSNTAAEQGGKVFVQARLVIIAGSIFAVLAIGAAAVTLRSAKSGHLDATASAAAQQKISLAFFVITALYLAFGGLFYQQLARVNEQLAGLNGNWIPSIISINALNTQISDYRVTETLSVLSDQDDEFLQWDQKIKTLTHDIADTRNRYEALITSTHERNLYAEFSASFAEYASASEQTLALMRNNEPGNATQQLKQNGILFGDFRPLLADLVDLNQRGGVKNGRTIDTALQTLKIITVGGAVFILLLLTICALLVESWLCDEPLGCSAGEQGRPVFTIKLKLRLAFLGMAATLLLFRLLVKGLMDAMNSEVAALETNWIPSIITVNSINTTINEYRNAEAQHISATDAANKLYWDKKIKRLLDKMAKIRAFYEPLISSEEERDIYQHFSNRYDAYIRNSAATLVLSRKQDANAHTELQKSRVWYHAATADLRKLVDLNSISGIDSAQSGLRIFSEAQQTIFAVVLAIFTLAILFMVIFDKNISVALQQLTAQMRRVAKGDIVSVGDACKKRRDEIGQMANALSVVTATLQALAHDAIELADAAQAGVLSARVDAQRHPGEFGRIIAGLNALIAVLSQPLSEAAQIMQNLALGDLDGRMTGQYDGELLVLKTNVNRSLDALVNLLTELSASMQHMAHADLTHTLSGNYQGEFSVLKANINQTLAQLVAILKEIIDSTAQSAVAVTQTSESSKYVAEESVRQLVALENVFGTLEETAASSHEIAQKAKESSVLATATAGSAKAGQVQLHKLIELIQHVDAEYVRIEKITDEITRIADKTHLLSLNAGLEAMRAGEHGAGFGFVAQQIGQLAEEVSVSARDIGGVISSSGQKIRLGVHAMQETQAAMEQIAKDAQTSQNNVEHISVAVVQQSAAIKSLTERVNDIRASSEASASAAEQISATMLHLAQTVRDTAAYAKRFKIAED